MMRKLIQITIFLLLSTGLMGQDVHFSQFYRSPQTLNPALTGLFLSNHRVVFNYRNQWASVMSPFQTFAASYDGVIDPSGISSELEGDFIGAGGYFVKDQAGDAGYNSTRFMASGAYHKALDEEKTHYLAAGFQLGGVQDQIDFTKLRFSSQWDRDTRFDNPQSSGEQIQDQSQLYFDMQMGAMWYYFIEGGANIFAGASLFHVTQPDVSFLSTEEHERKHRLVLHTGSRLPITEQLGIVPNFLIMKQRSNQEINIGASAEYMIDGQNRVAFGTWYRAGDAVILSGMFEYDTYSLGLSYDINVSELRAVSGGKGGFEISLILVYPPEKSAEFSDHPCPRL
jgi:type IX secretion system PorP/SprF family membrane protein